MENLSMEVQRALQFFFTSTQYHAVDHILLAGGSAVIPASTKWSTPAQVATSVANPVLSDAGLAAHPAQAPDGRRAVADRRLRPRHEEVRPAMNPASTCCPHRADAASARGSGIPSPAAPRSSASRSRSSCTSTTSADPDAERRNNFLATEIKKLDKDIAEINELRNQIQALLARKQIIETLQADRAQTVHLLEQMVRQMPGGCI